MLTAKTIKAWYLVHKWTGVLRGLGRIKGY